MAEGKSTTQILKCIDIAKKAKSVLYVCEHRHQADYSFKLALHLMEGPATCLKRRKVFIDGGSVQFVLASLHYSRFSPRQNHIEIDHWCPSVELAGNDWLPFSEYINEREASNA